MSLRLILGENMVPVENPEPHIAETILNGFLAPAIALGGQIDPHGTVSDRCRVTANSCVFAVGTDSGGKIKLPLMPGAGHDVAIDRAAGEVAACVGAGIVNDPNGVPVVHDENGVFVAIFFHEGASVFSAAGQGN